MTGPDRDAQLAEIRRKLGLLEARDPQWGDPDAAFLSSTGLLADLRWLLGDVERLTKESAERKQQVKDITRNLRQTQDDLSQAVGRYQSAESNMETWKANALAAEARLAALEAEKADEMAPDYDFSQGVRGKYAKREDLK